MAFTQAPPREVAFSFYQSILDNQETHFVAVQGDEVIGWCDVLRQFHDMRRHVGTLGMGVAARCRRQGVGRALVEAALAHAAQRGLTRIELTVHVENTVAQALYERVGFRIEGTQVRGWRLDGRYDDVLAMARLSEG